MNARMIKESRTTGVTVQALYSNTGRQALKTGREDAEVICGGRLFQV